MKRCSRCACIFYCSVEHQKRHWKRHRRLCSYLSTAAEEVGADNFFGKGYVTSICRVRKKCCILDPNMQYFMLLFYLNMLIFLLKYVTFYSN